MSQARPATRACNTCKARRIKCDEERPLCQRCLRSGRECSYSTDFDRVHRDETRRTQRRVVQTTPAAPAQIPATSAVIPGAAPTPFHPAAGANPIVGTTTNRNVRNQPAAARAAARQRTANPAPPTTAAVLSMPAAPTTIHLTPRSSSSVPVSTSDRSRSVSSSSPSAVFSLPVRSSLSPGASSASADGMLDLASISGRNDGVPFLQSAEGMETSAFVAGNEVSHDVAEAAGALASGYGSRFFWRGPRYSPATYYAHMYTPENYATGPTMNVDSSPPRSRMAPSYGGGFVHGEIHDDEEQTRYTPENEWQRPASTLSLPIGELALCYFASNFMLIPRQPFGGTYFEFIVPVLQGQPPDSAMQYALRACAFSALGNRWVSDTVDFHAIGLSQYTAALAKTTQSLKDPRQKTADATLATVLLLGLFESITAKKEMFAWRSHIEGAVQIVHNRGPRKIRSRVEKLLFNSVRMQLIHHSMTADTPPTWSINWRSGENIQDSATVRSQRFLMETSQLRREQERHIATCAGQQSISPDEFSMYLLRVRAIDNEMANFLESIPKEYKPYTLAIAGEVPDGDYENAEAFPGRVDMYSDITMASVWVGIRSCRLVMSCLIVRCMALTCPPGTDYRTLPEFLEEMRRCNSLIADVVAAVPYFLGSTPPVPSIVSDTVMPYGQYGQYGHSGPKRRVATSASATSGFACGDDHGHGLPKVLAGYLLVWPLAGAYTHDCASPAQRAYIAGRFKYMGNVLGLRYALVCQQTPFRFPSMMMYRDRLIISGTPANSPPSASSSVGSPPSVGLGKTPVNTPSPEAS
ncbi:hypothetical protein Sste5346_006039 [Sporothrix stenoceras]|uniref:Zn(2)-C6 fungal-type domain-containing protein n=1 Tax=Sporothrix stenoceras TaxID=5173 RepID=A0ABR3Z2J2_9PEZI